MDASSLSLMAEEGSVPPGDAVNPGGSVGSTGIEAHGELERNAEFAELYRTHRVRLHRLALKLTGRPDRADDLVSEAFLRAWRAYGKFRGEAAFGTWMHRILTNLVYDTPARREDELPPDLPAVSGSNPHADAEASLVRVRIDEALAVLSPSQRQVFLLRDVEGLRHAAIGARLGISESTSKVHYFHALKRLREELHDLV